MIRKLSITKILVILLIIAGVMIYFFGRVSKFNKVLKEGNKVTYNLDKEYLYLLSENAKKKMTNALTYSNKSRNPVSFFDYDEKFRVVVTKTDLAKNCSLANIVNEENGPVGASSDPIYISHGNTGVDLHYRSELITPVSIIYLTFSKPEKVLIKNDTIINYFLKNSEFSMKYGKDSAVDIFTENSSPFYTTESSKDLLLIRRNNILYLVAISPYNSKDKLDEGILYKSIVQ